MTNTQPFPSVHPYTSMPLTPVAGMCGIARRPLTRLHWMRRRVASVVKRKHSPAVLWHWPQTPRFTFVFDSREAGMRS